MVVVWLVFTIQKLSDGQNVCSPIKVSVFLSYVILRWFCCYFSVYSFVRFVECSVAPTLYLCEHSGASVTVSLVSLWFIINIIIRSFIVNVKVNIIACFFILLKRTNKFENNVTSYLHNYFLRGYYPLCPC